MLNEDLELTPQAEIRQLKRVIAEKNKAIEAFKAYDAKRSEEYNRMVDEKREAAMKANPVMPSVQHENKVLS